jgi:hypothetical protein
MKIEDLLSDEKVVEVIQSRDKRQLAKLIGKRYFEFTDADEKYIDMFWDPVFNKSWLYASDEMVNEQFGYKKSESMMKDFHNKLSQEFKSGYNYQQVDKTHELVLVYKASAPGKKDARGGHNKKHFIITGDTYKSLLQGANTEKGKQTRSYFVKVEGICGMVSDIMLDFMERAAANALKALEAKEQDLAQATQLIEAKDKVIATLEKSQLKLKSFVTNIKEMETTQCFYVSTTPNYAAQNRFEYGGVKNENSLKQRFYSYNTGRAEGDIMYICMLFKCNDYSTIEHRVNSILRHFKDKPGAHKEMVHLQYDCLIEVITLIYEHGDKEIRLINSNLQRYINNTVEGESIIPPPLNLAASVPLCLPAPESETKEHVEADAAGNEPVPPPQATPAPTARPAPRRKPAFNANILTDEQIIEGVRQALAQYRAAHPTAAVSWHNFKEILRVQFDVPKSRFKATWWKPKVQREVPLVA